MPKSIDWLYTRKSCDTCKRAASYCRVTLVSAKESVDATTVRIGSDAALTLLEGVSKVIAARGKSIKTFDLRKNRPDDETLLAQLIGPTGNLRAPTARVGKTLLVGFNPDMYGEVLGT